MWRGTGGWGDGGVLVHSGGVSLSPTSLSLPLSLTAPTSQSSSSPRSFSIFHCLPQSSFPSENAVLPWMDLWQGDHERGARRRMHTVRGPEHVWDRPPRCGGRCRRRSVFGSCGIHRGRQQEVVCVSGPYYMYCTIYQYALSMKVGIA